MTKRMQWLAAIALVVGGILLLCASSQAQAQLKTNAQAQLKTNAPAQLNPKAAAPTRFTVVDEGTLGKPDVVLVPGLTSSREVWAGEAKLLAPNYRLHLVQVNGFAGQPAGPNATGEILPAIVDELHAYCETLNTKPVVIGHSLGGLLTLMLAAKYPSDARKIVIVDSLPFLGMLFGPQLTPAIIKPQAEQMRDKLQQQDADKRKAGAKQTAEKLVLNPEKRPLVEANSEDSDAHVVAEATFEDLQTDLRSDLAEIKVPALMLYPFDSTLKVSGAAATRDVDELYQGAYKPMPNVTTVRVDASRHFIMLDQPEKFDTLLEGFLKQ
ncbi:MAG: alpha/beta hydrolase [Terriglobales bacterium]